MAINDNNRPMCSIAKHSVISPSLESDMAVGIKKLIDEYEKCLARYGNYVKK